MYKLTITQLKALKDSLVKSNELLKELMFKVPQEESDVDNLIDFNSVIEANQKQINFITQNFKIDE